MRFRNLFSVLTAFFLSAPVYAGSVHELIDANDVVGTLSSYVSQYEDTMVDIGRTYNLGFEELRLANPAVDPWLPGEGTELILPTAFILPRAQRQGLVVNIAEYRVYFYYRVDEQSFVAALPVSIGRMDWATPLGRTQIVARAERPSWYPPESVRQEHAADGRELPRVVPPGPDNPLGEYALRLALPGYLIHGTNRPSGVGMQVTHGCIRLFPEDIRWLFPRTAVGMPVQIVNQPVKFGWVGDELYLEVHPALELEEGDSELNMTVLTEEFVHATQDRSAEVDWDLITSVFMSRRGLPVKVGQAVVDDGQKKAAADAAAFSG